MADYYEGKMVTHRRHPEWGVGLVEGTSYTKRFLDAQDHEMIAHGMGEYAGSYGTAVNVMFPQTGQSYKGMDVSKLAVIPPPKPSFSEVTQ